jgi:HAE1 family hydrophobic/amphiphilic exporter-1
MTLSEICVRRPVFATMLVSACVAFGVLSFGKLGVDRTPNVDLPVVTVTTVLRGASPEEIETQVTKVIEDAVSTSEGIDELRSNSLEGVSSVTVNFVLDRKGVEAVQDVRDKVAAILGQLPVGTEPPVITRRDTSASPVLTLVLSGNRSLRELTDIADKRVLETLQGLSGVGDIQIVGGRTRAFDIDLDASRLAELGLTVSDVRTAIQAQNVEVPGGRLESAGREEVLRTVARVTSADELRAMVISERQGAPVTLGAVARIADAEEQPRSLSRLDGVNAVALVVQKQAGTNTVEVVDTVLARLATLQRALPEDLSVKVVRDESTFIRRSIHEVELHLVLGALLASVCVLLFMGSFRSTIIAALAIPSSIITTFAVLRALDYTLNNFTLLALTLAVGIVIDDAIVVLENIYRHIEEGESPFDAAIRGTKEITLAVVATTLSLIVIFLPTAFMEGRVGRFWQSFGITTAFAIGISLLIALTLTPMLCSRWLKPKKHEAEGAKKSLVARFNGVLDRGYGALVAWSLRWRWLVVLVSVAVVLSTIPLSGLVGKDFMPQDDTNEFSVALTMPEGSDLASASTVAAELEQKLRTLRGVELIWTRIGAQSGGDDVTQVEIYVRIAPLEKRSYSQFDVMDDARAMLAPYADLRPSVSNVGSVGGGHAQLSFSLRGPDLDRLNVYAARLMDRMRTDPAFVDVDSGAAVRKPEVRVLIDRQRAADLGIRAGEVATALRTMVGGEPVSKIRVGDEQYDVWLRLRPADRESIEALRGLSLRGRSGLVRLDTIGTFERDRSPAQITRMNRVRQVEVGANLAGVPLGTAVDRVKALAADLDFPPGYEIIFSGRAKLFDETLRNLFGALMLSFIFMYMVLAAQFESFLHPITILLSLPLSLPFALLSLILMNDTLNIYSAFGVFMLFGIVKKNGILQVDFTNQLIKQGIARNEAIVRANVTRLRPILMTTLTLIAGMTPIALGRGPGAASRASMANVIIGGQALSLLITLLIVPVAYSLFDDAGRLGGKLRARFRKPPAEAPSEPETPAPETSEAESAE